MDPILVVSGIMLCLGSVYWWQQKIAIVAGMDGMNNSFMCLVSVGMHNCPSYVLDNLQNEIWQASLMFYAGIFLLLYSAISAKPPMPPPNPL